MYRLLVCCSPFADAIISHRPIHFWLLAGQGTASFCKVLEVGDKGGEHDRWVRVTDEDEQWVRLSEEGRRRARLPKVLLTEVVGQVQHLTFLQDNRLPGELLFFFFVLDFRCSG